VKPETKSILDVQGMISDTKTDNSAYFIKWNSVRARTHTHTQTHMHSRTTPNADVRNTYTYAWCQASATV
jgi:hypothetical protein